MINFDLTYNPFTKEKVFLVNGNPDSFEECWGADNKELSEWCSKFYKCLYNKFNDSVMTVNFKGIDRDFDFLEDAKVEYEKENEKAKITLCKNGCVDINEKLNELKKLFCKMQNETPFDELRSEDLKDLFNKIVSADVEIAVVATMSSGKSTLINAFLGRKLLPSKTGATTATIARIHDIDSDNLDFKAISYDKDHKRLEYYENLSRDDMAKMNGDRKTSVIEIYGDIKQIKSKGLKLVLIDTPGTNSSEHPEHKDCTYDLLTAPYKPLILYVLNPSNTGSDSVNNLINDIKEIMNSGGRQSQDRFIFVLNKADELEFDDEDVESVIKNNIDFLEKKCDIKNIRIFPAAAEMARDIRQKQNNDKMSTSDSDYLDYWYDKFITRPCMHFSNYAPLSTSAKKNQNEMIASAKASNDKYQEALIYTGIPAIELAISEYLEKYALPAKIKEGVLTFKETVNNLGIEARENERLSKNQDEVDKLKTVIDKLETVLSKGEKAKSVCEKIDSISINENLMRKFEEISSNLMSKVSQKTQGMNNPNMPREEAEKCHSELCSLLSDLESKFHVDIKNTLENVLQTQAQEAVNEYNEYIKELIKDVSYEMHPAAILGDMASISVASTLNTYSKIENVKVGEHKEEEPGVWGAIKRFFSGGRAGYTIVPIFEEKEFINFSEFLAAEVLPEFLKSAKSTEELALEVAREEENKFKTFFKQEFKKLESKIMDKISEKKDYLTDKTKFENEIERNRKNLEWLSNFVQDLDSLLAI